MRPSSAALRALRGIELGYSELDLAELWGRHETISRCGRPTRRGLPALPAAGRRPLGSGRSLADPQAERIQACIDFHAPENLGIPHALWTRRAVRDLSAGSSASTCRAHRRAYLRRWGYTLQAPEPARTAAGPARSSNGCWRPTRHRSQAEREGAEIL